MQKILKKSSDMATKKRMAKEVIIGGISGIVLGASSMATTGNAIIDDIAADDAENSGENYEDKSFGDAFAAAREDLGPGATFEWHGNLYSTFTAEEWNAAHPSGPIVGTAADVIDAEEDLPSDEVEILGMEEDEDIAVEVETGNDINGDEAAFVDIEEDMQTDAVEDVFVDYSNDDAPIM